MLRRFASVVLPAAIALLLTATDTAAQDTPGAGTTSPDTTVARDGSAAQQAEVLIETGLAMPLGDLAAGYRNTQRGMGAELGYLIGLRLRFYPAPYLVLAPHFNYVEFGDYDGTNTSGQPFAITVRTLRYALDVQYVISDRDRTLRPFVGAGAAFLRNTYQEASEAAGTEFRAGVHSLAWSLGAGVRLTDWEFAVHYEVNHFRTTQFSHAALDQRHAWNSLRLRVSYQFPRW